MRNNAKQLRSLKKQVSKANSSGRPSNLFEHFLVIEERSLNNLSIPLAASFLFDFPLTPHF